MEDKNKDQNLPETERSSIDEQEVKARLIKSRWTKISKLYADHSAVNYSFLPHMLAGLLGVEKAKAILEVGCGDGVNATEFCFIKPQSTKLYATDITPLMCAIAHEKLRYLETEILAKGDYSMLRKRLRDHSRQIRDEEYSEALQFFDSEIGQKRSSKLLEKINVEVLSQNAENLESFETGSIDVYFSSICMMLVGNPQKMVEEAFRVLSSGGRAGISVWGSKEHSEFFSIPSDVQKEFGVYKEPGYDIWALGDRDALIGRFEAIGFRNVICWEEYVPFLFFEQDGSLESFVQQYLGFGLRGRLEPELAEKILDEIYKRLAGYLRNEKRSFGLSNLWIVAEKP